MNNIYLNETVARQRVADIDRRARRAQRPEIHPATTPRQGIRLEIRWPWRRVRFAGG